MSFIQHYLKRSRHRNHKATRFNQQFTTSMQQKPCLYVGTYIIHYDGLESQSIKFHKALLWIYCLHTPICPIKTVITL